MTPRSLWVGVQDAGLALVVTALGLAELWVPFESVYGSGSNTVSTVGVVLAGSALGLRRLRVEASIAVFVVWLVIGVATLGEMHALFFGQVVPFMFALYSLARHGVGRLPWIGGAVAALALLVGDFFIEALQGLDEVIFHWTMCSIAFTVGWGLRKSEQRAVASALRLNRAEHAAQEELMAAVSGERARIARELHDILAHSVSVMVVQAGAAEQAVDDDPDFVRQALQNIRSTGTDSLEEVRRVVAMLRDPADAVTLDPQPGMSSLESLIEASQHGRLGISLRTEGHLDVVPPGLGLAVYRIVQEALTNVHKHSNATRVHVLVRASTDGVLVEVEDNGTKAHQREGTRVGHGLIGMHERASFYGGLLDAGPTDGGFRVRATIPISVVANA